MTNLYRLSIAYIFAMILFAAGIKSEALSSALMIVSFAVFLIHRHFAKQRNDKIMIASINRPIAIVDPGEAGERLIIPEIHKDFVWLTPGHRIEEKYQEICRLLIDSGNDAYMKGALPVLKIYFRFDQHCLDTQEEHEAYLWHEIDQALLKFHADAREKGGDEAYIKDYFQKL